MDVYKENLESYGSLYKLKLRVVIRGDLYDKRVIGYIWSPTASMRTLKYLLADASKNKSRVHQFGFIGALLQANLKHIVFVQLYRRYG